MRTVLTILCAALLAAWADAQATPIVLTAGERMAQLQSNRALLEKLVSHSVSLSNANDPLSRTAACRAAMGELASAVDAAILARNAGRIAELGDYLTAIVTDGLIPTMTEARSEVPLGSAEETRLLDLHKQATEDMARLDRALPRTDSLSRSGPVNATLTRWDTTRTALAKLFNAK